MLTARKLGKRFSSRWLFRNLELDLGLGDCLVVQGSNGSGKSTLLRILADLVEPSEGLVERPGTLGYSGIDLAVYPELSGLEHLALAADLRGCPSRAEGLLETVGLTASGNQMAKEYSTGMRARLKLAIAIQHTPLLLILDEPMAGLDSSGREIVGEVLAAHLEVGCAVIATNESEELRFASHRLSLD